MAGSLQTVIDNSRKTTMNVNQCEVSHRPRVTARVLAWLGIVASAGCGAAPNGSETNALEGATAVGEATPASIGDESAAAARVDNLLPTSGSMEGSQPAVAPSALLASDPVIFNWEPADVFPISMMNINDGVCFLTGFSGNFQSMSDEGGVFIFNQVWNLGGVGGASRLSAACYHWSTLSAVNQKFLTQFTLTASASSPNPPALRMWNDDAFCTIAKVTGALNGGGEDIVLSVSNGGWWLKVRSQATAGTKVVATCFSAHSGVPVNLDHTAWIFQDNPSITMASQSLPCGFTTLSGRFRGAGEDIGLFPVNSNWLFQVLSQQVSVAATATCTFPSH
jgi:hypothetical protein